MSKPKTTLDVDGHQISIAFSQTRNETAISQAQQILLSAFSGRDALISNRTFAECAAQRDN